MNSCRKPSHCCRPHFKKCTPEEHLVKWLDCRFDELQENVIVITQSDIDSTGYVTPREGVYRLGCPLIFNPLTPGLSAITITQNNVLLDLNGFTLSQGNALLQTNGIRIAPSVSNIAIINGTIRDFKGASILADGITDPNTANKTITLLEINHVNVLNNGDASLDGYGGITLFGVRSVFIDHVHAIGNHGAGIYLRGYENVTITNSNSSYTVDTLFGVFTPPANAAYGLLALGILNNLPTSKGLRVEDSVLSNNNGTFGKGMYIVGGVNVSLINNDTSGNRGTQEAFGVDFFLSSKFLVKDCTANDNVLLPSAAVNVNAAGFRVLSSPLASGVFDGCVGNGNSSQRLTPSLSDSVGIRVSGSQNVTIKNSEFSNNSGLSGQGAGIFLVNTSNIIIDNNTISTNSSNLGLVNQGGIVFLPADDTIVSNNKLTGNIFGIFTAPGSDRNTFVNNIVQNSPQAAVIDNGTASFYFNNVFRGIVSAPFTPPTSQPPVNNQVV